MPGVPHYSPEVKTQIVSALMAGVAITEISRSFGVSKQTVIRIRQAIPNGEMERIGTQSRHRLDELLVDAVAANLAAQKYILDAVCDRDYLRKHDPEKVGNLFGQVGDHAVRVLEIAGPFLAQRAEDDDA